MNNIISIDNYFIYLKENSNQFYVSEYGGLDIDPLSYASSEGDPDKIVTGIANHRDLILFNENSTEIFSNVGNADFPFERVQGGFIEKGCLAANSVAKIDGTVFWLSKDKSGPGIIYALKGMVPQRVSTHAVEQKISTYTNIEDATAYTYQKEGHSFYVINFTEGSWCFDVSTGQWHERLHLASGSLSRFRAEQMAFIPIVNKHICGDFESNKVYELNDDYHLIDTDPFLRERTFPHISASGLQMRCNALRIDMEVGVGINGTAQGSDPKAMLKWSDDDGRTWSNERTASIGKIGETFKRVIFWRLGTYRKRIYKLRITDPVKVNILSVDVDIEVGTN